MSPCSSFPPTATRSSRRRSRSGADILLLDLEDSVAAGRKPRRRDMALAYLRSEHRKAKLYVRVNALNTGLTLGDLAIVIRGKPDGIVFPKWRARPISTCSRIISTPSRRARVSSGGTTKILTIATESAAAILALAAAPAKHARLMGHSSGARI